MISFITFTRNSARDLALLLDNVSDVVDEIIIVIDGFSTDDTLEVARAYNAKVYWRRPLGVAEPHRRYALSKASHEWILYLDPDERLGRNLKKNLRSLIDIYGNTYDAFWITRVNILKGKPLLGRFFPDRQLRIFRKSKATFKGIIHEFADINGKTLELPEDYYILHFGPSDFRRWRKRSNIFARMEALQIYKHGGNLLERSLRALAPFSMPLIYIYRNMGTLIRKYPMNYLALYETLVHTLTKLRTRREKLFAAIVQRCGFIDLIESRERGEDLITFISRCLANKT